MGTSPARLLTLHSQGCNVLPMTNEMREALEQAKELATAIHLPRIGPWIPESVFWSLRKRGYVNDSGWLTDKGLNA